MHPGIRNPRPHEGKQRNQDDGNGNGEYANGFRQTVCLDELRDRQWDDYSSKGCTWFNQNIKSAASGTTLGFWVLTGEDNTICHAAFVDEPLGHI